MPRLAERPSVRAAVAALMLALVVLAATLATSGAPPARAASAGQLQQQISSGQQRIPGLAGRLAAASRHVNQLNASIATLQQRLTGLQSDLDAKRTELLRLRSELTNAQVKLKSLEAAQARSEQVLGQQLIGRYEGDRPDIVSVVLEARGFSDLLERLSFAQRISRQDAQIVGKVRGARRAVAAEATRLGVLSARQQRLTEQVLSERNRVASVQLALVQQRLAAARVRSAAAGQLAGVKDRVASLSDQLAKLQAAQQAAQAQASAPSGTGGTTSPPNPGPVSSSGGFTFPMPKSDASPPSTWSLDDGVDIAAPGGTPLLAVCSGTVVLHGIGGFGPSAPVLHCDGSLAGYDYVYYGHAGPGNWVPIGTHVGQGQVISQVGYGIVGISTGPHLEVGFADSSGSPVGPGSASQMASLLHAAYGG